MGNQLSSVQISKEFKEVLRREKEDKESYEDYLKRSLPEKQSIEQSIDTKQSIELSKTIFKPQTEFIEEKKKLQLSLTRMILFLLKFASRMAFLRDIVVLIKLGFVLNVKMKIKFYYIVLLKRKSI